VRKDVLICIEQFFKNHNLLRKQNHTFLALIPKISGSHTAHQFRPISLCNIVYKIISKILANRFKRYLPKIISPLQSAFVPQRNIQDNTILAHELLHAFKSKRGKGGFMFMKMDMEKAFDRMEWSFLLAVLEKLGFSQTWLSWIRICISSTSFSILLNGSPFGLFSPGRGLRQGDPLSPFLFILGAEVFSRLMFKEEGFGRLKGLRIARNCSPIHHLLFADDLLIFGEASVSVAASIKSCLDKYCRWSGQAINTSKSSIRFSRNTNPTTSDLISIIIPYPSNTNSSLYLGLPTLMGNSKKRAFQGIIDKVYSRIDGWRAKTLSQAGRLVLIKSVAAALPSYAMSTFLLPMSFCNELDRIFRNFWWGFPAKKSRNLSLKAWDSLCIPKLLGGLGLRKMREVNLALVSKLGWKLLTKTDSLWVSQLHCKYLKSCTFLSPPSLSSSSSWLWKGILKTLPFISKGACHKIHSYSSLPIWSSNWIPTITALTPTPSTHLTHPYPNLIISDLFHYDHSHSAPSWNTPLLHHLFDTSTIGEILKIKISNSEEESFFWTPAANGQFSTKSALSLISSQRTNQLTSPLSSSNWKHLWKLKLNDRLKLFLWKIAWDIVPSKSRLNQVFPIPQDKLICPLCNGEEDSLSHLFFRCFFARITWRYSPWPLDSMKWAPLSLSDWIKGILNPHSFFGVPFADTHPFQIFAAVMCDMMWFSRNQAMHKGVIPEALKLAENIRRVYSEHIAAWSQKQNTKKDTWTKPSQDWCKISFKAIIKNFFSIQVAVCKNNRGEIMQILTQIRPLCSQLNAEALAANLAAQLALTMQLKKFILEGESSTVIAALHNQVTSLDSMFNQVIKDTFLSFLDSSLWEAKKISRNENFCAHDVAYRAAARVPPGCIPSLFSPPSSIPICNGKDPPPSTPH
jgi:hypothetical protein